MKKNLKKNAEPMEAPVMMEGKEKPVRFPPWDGDPESMPPLPDLKNKRQKVQSVKSPARYFVMLCSGGARLKLLAIQRTGHGLLQRCVGVISINDPKRPKDRADVLDLKRSGVFCRMPDGNFMPLSAILKS